MIERYYRIQEVQHVGTETPHAYFIPFNKMSDTLKNREDSPYFISLCGEWDFKFFKNIEDINLNAPGFPSSVSCSTTLQVPMCWQLQKDGGFDVPNYINQDYPFPVDPPHLPDVIPCGFYRKSFDIKKQKGKSYYINFDGVSSCFYLWVNGHFIGYSEVSHCNSEFDITQALSNGINVFEILVIKHCTGSYMEDQDFFRLSGIFRPVYILERDNVHLKDLQIKTSVSDDLSSAVINVTPKMTVSTPMNWTLLSPAGDICSIGQNSSEFNINVGGPTLWNTEAPALYTLRINIGSEHIAFPIGIKKLEIKNSCLLLNGQKIKLKGINRHDTSPETGYCTSVAQMTEDLFIMKRANVNTIRTSHYPNDPRFPGLCDRLGFMLIDEADLETHGMGYNYGDWDWKYWAFICDDPSWREACVDRAKRLYERDKNHACVIMWSLGNESGCGNNHRYMAEYIRVRDPKAIIHYENAHLEYEARLGEDFKSISDVESRMYAPTDYLKKYLEDPNNTKPFFYCEYVSSQCTGDIPLYWDDFEKYDNYCGGCIWEFADHAVNIGTKDKPKYRYGGDFGDWPNDGISCVDGLVYPDRRPRPGYYDMQDTYKPFEVSYAEGCITVKNKRFFTPLTDTYIEWTVEEEGEVKRSGKIESPDIPPQQKKEFQLFAAYEPHVFTTLNIYLKQSGATDWAEADTEIGHTQFVLKNEPITFISDKKSPLCIEISRNEYTVKNENYSCVFDRQSGKLASVTTGRELFSEPLEFSITKSTHPWNGNNEKWKRARYDKAKQKTYGVELLENTPERVKIKASVSFAAAAMPPAVKAEVIYTFTDSGKINISVSAAVNEKAPSLPRFGLQITMPKECRNIKYIGYGPEETYADRFRSQMISTFNTTAKDNFEHYIYPCESSAHFGTKIAAVTDERGKGFVIYDNAKKGFCFNAKHYSDSLLAETMHDDELVELDKTIVNIDYKMHSENTAFADKEPWRTFDEKEFSFSFDIIPV